MNLIISFCHIGSQWGQKFYGIFKINELKSQSGFLRTQSVAKKAWLAILSHIHMGKSLSEALIFELTNPQYDDILFIELQVLILAFRTIYVHNMFSLCSAKIRASDKDLSVLVCKAIVGFQISCVGLTLSVTLFLNTILCVAKISRNILFCQFQNWKLCD